MENLERTNNLETNETPEEVLLRVILQRHGPKRSASGEKNETALYFGSSVDRGFEEMNIGRGKGLVHISSSPVKRAMDTATIDLEKISATEHRHRVKIEKQKELATPFQPSGEAVNEKHARDLETIIKIQKTLETFARNTVEREYPNLSPEKKEEEMKNVIDTQVLNILFDQAESRRYGLQTTYEEMADNLAQRYAGFLNHAGLLDLLKKKGGLQPKNEPYIQIDVSHSFPIMSFLKKFLVFDDGVVARDMRPQDFFDKIGGTIRESSSLELDYSPESNGYVVRVKGCFTQGENFSGQLNFKK